METSEGEIEAGETSEAVDTAVDEAVDTSEDVSVDDAPEPEFDWTGWDGTLDVVPEKYRDVAGHVVNYYTPKLSELESQLVQMEELRTTNSDLHDLLEALSDGREDPRIQELTEAQAQAQKEYETMQQQYRDLEAAIEQQNDLAADQYAQWFQQEYPQFWENEELGALLGQLIDREWEPAVAADALLLGAKGFELVADAIERGVPGDFALDHARHVLEAETRHTPSPSANLVSGGGAPAQRGRPAEDGLGDVNSLEDRRSVIALRAFKKHGLV